MRFTTDVRIPIHTLLSITLINSKNIRIHTEGMVIWGRQREKHKYTYGIKFINTNSMFDKILQYEMAMLANT